MDVCIRALKISLLPGVVIFSAPLSVQAAPSQTYVIDTYGGDALLPAVRQQLNASPEGGSASTYQGKLVLHTTPANYQAVQQLLKQIDTQPEPLSVAVRVGNSSSTQGSNQRGRVIISNRGIQGAGVINQSSRQQQSNNLYQVQTLSGSSARIGTDTLYALTQNSKVNSYARYNPSASAQIIIQQQVLLPTIQGIQVTPRLLPNGQVEVNLAQAEETLVQYQNSQNRYNQSAAIQAQRLNSTIVVPRGQWVTIGQIAQSNQTQNSRYGSSVSTNSTTPIIIRIE